MSTQVNLLGQKPIVQMSVFHAQASRDILFEIFAYLTPIDLVNCSEVCRLFKDITNIENFTEQKTLWTRLFKKYFPNAIPPEKITQKKFAELALFEKRFKQGLCTSSIEIINSKSINEACYANLSSDGKVILAFKNGLIRICDPVENTCIELVPENKQHYHQIHFGHTNKIVCYYDNKVAVWDIQKRKHLGSFEIDYHPSIIRPNLIMLTENQIAFLINDYKGFKVYNLETADIIFTENQAHQAEIIKIIPIKHGKIATLLLDQTLKIWDVQEKKCTHVISPAYAREANPILFEIKTGQIFFLSLNNQPCLLDPETGEQIQFITHNETEPLTLLRSHIFDAFETQNNKILLNCYEFIYVLDCKTYKTESIPLISDNKFFRHIRSLPSDKILCFGKGLRILDLQTKKIISSIEIPYRNDIEKITMTKDQKILILQLTNDNTIQSLVTLNFTDSIINILRDLANMFDARPQYYELEIESLSEVPNPIHCKDQFERLATQDKNAIYRHLYLLIKDSLFPEQDYWEVGQRAFHNQCTIKVTDKQRAKAIYSYALELEKNPPHKTQV